MAENRPSPPGDRDEMYAAMRRLLRDAQRVRSAHFIAAQRKGRNSKLLGVSVIVLNVLIGSGLVEAVLTNQNNITTAIKGLSFLAAALAGVQTFFNYQKEVECHTNAGDVYSSINHRISLVMAEYQNAPANRDALVSKFKSLSDEYLKANVDSKGCVPTEKDFKKARASIKARSGGDKHSPQSHTDTA